jgi:dTDP-glucose pyrophosphorylase
MSFCKMRVNVKPSRQKCLRITDNVDQSLKEGLKQMEVRGQGRNWLRRSYLHYSFEQIR